MVRGVKLAVIFIWSSGLFSGIAFCETLKIGYFYLPPHSSVENEIHSGALIEYWENFLAPQMKIRLKWMGPLPPLRLLSSLESGQINVIALLAKNDERAQQFDFPDKPFYTMTSGLALLKINPLNHIGSAADIADFKIGFWSKGFKAPAIRDLRIQWEYVTAFNWIEQNIVKLLRGRIDAAYCPEIHSLKYVINKSTHNPKIKTLEIPQTSSGLYSLFSKKDHQVFLKKYANARTIIDHEINYETILKRHLKLQ